MPSTQLNSAKHILFAYNYKMKLKAIFGFPSCMSIGLILLCNLLLFIDDASASQPYALKHTILEDSFTAGPSMFNFDIQDKTDFSRGFVETVDYQDARRLGLVSSRNGSTYIGVNYKDLLPTDHSVGRQSVSLWTYSRLNEGLYIIDILHAPTAACGLWSAIQVAVADPSHTIQAFEIDPQLSNWLVENYNSQCGRTANNAITVRENNSAFADIIDSENGAVYALEWRAEVVNIWFWVRNSVPDDIKNGPSVDPTTWGPPHNQHSGNCGINPNLQQELNIRIRTTFCPPWASENYYKSDCFRTSLHCTHYVANNPSAYQDAYWLLNPIKVYEQPGEAAINDTDNSPTIKPPE